MALCACDACGGFASEAFREIQRLRAATGGANHKLLAEVAVEIWLDTISPPLRAAALDEAVARFRWRLEGEFL